MSSLPKTLEEAIRTHVLTVLEACRWSQIDTARALAVDRKTIYRMLRRWDVDVRELRAAHGA